MDRLTRNRFRYWGDGLAILASVTAIGFAMWAAPIAVSEADPYQGGLFGAASDLGWAAFALAGALGLAGVFIAQRPSRRRIGRVMLAAGGVIMLLGLLTVRDFGVYAIGTKLLPGLAMLAAAPFLGPMPEPEIGERG